HVEPVLARMLRWSSGDQSRRLALILANVIEAPSSGRPMCTAAGTGTGEGPTPMPDAGLSKRDELTEVVEAFRDALRSCQVKAFTARATMRPNSARATDDCTSIVYLARWVSGITSAGLNGVAFV